MAAGNGFGRENPVGHEHGSFLPLFSAFGGAPRRTS
jgi:hypothetical protein